MRDLRRWSKLVGVVGGVSLVVGSFDPIEGSVLILPGSALLALGYESSLARPFENDEVRFPGRGAFAAAEEPMPVV